jgi:uncharacterized membrane protein
MVTDRPDFSEKRRQSIQPGTPEEISEIIVDALKDDRIPESVMARVVERLAPKVVNLVHVTATLHADPLPSVEKAETYERLAPGSIDRMFKMAEIDQGAEIDSRKEALRRADRFRSMALLSGNIGLLFILGFATYLAMTGHDGAAIAVVGMGASGIVATLVNAASPFRRHQGESPSAAEQPEKK